MENDLISHQFDEIEEKVEKLIKFCKNQEMTVSDLRKKNEGLEQELQKKIEGENTLKEQKALVRSKIDSLLSKLNDFAESE
ncbi:cell division protein ZapB [bacterium]|nr:cell division protein ZapB [bacterium]